MRSAPNEKVRELLERAYTDFHSNDSRSKDPVSLAHAYPNPRDRELAALVAALLAYGNVRTILGSVRHVLRALGDEPHRGLMQGSYHEGLRPFRHRFTTGEDFEVLFAWLRRVWSEHDSLESFFVATSLPLTSPMRLLLSDFVSRLFALPLPPELAAVLRKRERNLRYLISDPARGSACKRLNMFLRWMVRPDDGIDLGLWKRLGPSQLVLPVDTHLLQTLRALRWTRSKQASWKVAELATERLRLYAPEDPIRYDFALCHLSMEGHRLHKYEGPLRKKP